MSPTLWTSGRTRWFSLTHLRLSVLDTQQTFYQYLSNRFCHCSGKGLTIIPGVGFMHFSVFCNLCPQMLPAYAFCISLHTKYIFPRLHAPEGNIGIVKQLKFSMCPIKLQYRPLPRSSLWPDSVVSEGSVIYSTVTANTAAQQLASSRDLAMSRKKYLGISQALHWYISDERQCNMFSVREDTYVKVRFSLLCVWADTLSGTQGKVYVHCLLPAFEWQILWLCCNISVKTRQKGQPLFLYFLNFCVIDIYCSYPWRKVIYILGEVMKK